MTRTDEEYDYFDLASEDYYDIHGEPVVQFEEPPDLAEPSLYTCPACNSGNVELSEDKERAHCYECLKTGYPEDFGWGASIPVLQPIAVKVRQLTAPEMLPEVA